MLHLLAIISFVLGVIFLAWSIAHGVWTWELFGMLGLTLWCISGKHDWDIPGGNSNRKSDA